MSEYIYNGDRFTDPFLKGRGCDAVRRQDGKCIRGKNGNMLVSFDGKMTVVVGRQLRKIDKVQVQFNVPIKKKKVLASDCQCCECDKPAVAFWPVVDPDIPSHAYCRKCLDNAKLSMLIKLQNLSTFKR